MTKERRYLFRMQTNAPNGEPQPASERADEGALVLREEESVHRSTKHRRSLHSLAMQAATNEESTTTRTQVLARQRTHIAQHIFLGQDRKRLLQYWTFS